MPRTPDQDGAMFEQLRPRLIAISRRIVGSQADAEDVVQDCFLKWRAAERAALLTPAAWLTTVVRHGSIDHLRRRRREQAALHAADAVDDVGAAPEDALLRRAELGEALAQLLARLSPAERLALVLHEVFDCPHADIAALLGARPDHARQHLARARRRLRERADQMQQTHRNPPDEQLCRDLIRRFHAALQGADIPAMTLLLTGEQPLFVADAPSVQARSAVRTNDACYRLAA
jgi:RNA polymerase sigma-70 factor (ECF subfamily)